jgi:Uma2 family endonuclease
MRHGHLSAFNRAEHIMGMPLQRRRRWTVAQVRAMQNESRAWPRYELIDGELLVTPAPVPAHQRAVYQLARLLDDYVSELRLGEVLLSPADLELVPGSIVQPDLFVVPADAAARRWSDIRKLLLAIEVLSPTSARHDRVTKRRFFARAGVPEYWIVDVDVRVVERWRAGDERGELLDEALEWRPTAAIQPLTVPLPEYFARVHREPLP